MNIFIAIGLTGWVGIARQTRAQVLAIKEKEFVEGARALGAGFARLLVRHVLPNALTPIVVAVTFGIPEAIFTEAALSFIGVGINPPTPSWGRWWARGSNTSGRTGTSACSRRSPSRSPCCRSRSSATGSATRSTPS